MTPEKIRQWRKQHGDITQARLAELLPTSKRNIENWEALPGSPNYRRPPEYLWRALAHLSSELEEAEPLHFYLELRESTTGERSVYGVFDAEPTEGMKSKIYGPVDLMQFDSEGDISSEELALQAIAKQHGIDLDRPETWEF